MVFDLEPFGKYARWPLCHIRELVYSDDNPVGGLRKFPGDIAAAFSESLFIGLFVLVLSSVVDFVVAFVFLLYLLILGPLWIVGWAFVPFEAVKFGR